VFRALCESLGQAVRAHRQRLEDVQSYFSRNTSVETFESFGKRAPIRRYAFVDACGDHLVDVAARDRDAVAESMEHPLCGRYLGRQAFEFGGTRNERTKIEAEGVFDLTPSPLRA